MKKTDIARELDLYKKMYHTLFNVVTDTIEQTEDIATKNILIKAQQDTEEIYMQG